MEIPLCATKENKSVTNFFTDKFQKMENSILEFFKFFKDINIVVVVLVLLAGLFAKNYLTGWEKSITVKTLIVASILTVVYGVFEAINGTFHRSDFSSYLLSYFFSTSLYDLLLKRFFSWLRLQPTLPKKRRS